MIRLAKMVLLAGALGSMLFAQNATAPAATSDSTENKASAYYHFAMGRLYAQLAASQGNNNDYVSKAIQHYQAALKADPSAGVIFQELTELYVQTGRIRDAVNQAEDMLKQNPDDLNARRLLGRIFVHASDSGAGRIDETYVKRAIDQYQKITGKDPKDAESWVMLGRLYRVTNNSPEAEKAFNAALAADPDNEDAVAQLAEIYADLGDSKRAIEKLKAAAAKSPNERILALLADQYEQANDFKNAAEVLKQARELAPDNPRIARGLALDLMYSDQLDDALKLLQQLAAQEPRDPSLPLNIAKIYAAKRNLAKARESLDKAKAIDGQNLEIRFQDVKLLELEGKTDQALTTLKGVLDDTTKKTYSEIEARRRAPLLEEYGILLRNAEKYPDAVDAFRQMAALGGDSAPRATVQIIDTYRQQKDYTSALRESEAALKKYPGERMVRMEHATVLAGQGKIDDAAAEIKTLLKGGADHEDYQTYISLAQIYETGKRYADMGGALDGAEKAANSNDEKETVYFMRGAMLERLKKFEESEAAFRKVLALDPENAGALNYLGYMLADRNVRLDEAQEMVKKALELEPNNGAYLDSMAWVYYRQGKLDEAQGLLLRALEHMNQDPTVHDHLGDVYLKQGRTRDAINQWQASLKAYQAGPSSDMDPDEVAKVTKKLDAARVRLAQETGKK
jgi:tetratricopeptide (TPR) repeat protein